MSRGCENAVEYMYHYLDDELTRSRKARIRWHLRRCIGCAGAYDFEGRLKQMIREKGTDQPPPELFDRLRTLIREEMDHQDGTSA